MACLVRIHQTDMYDDVVETHEVMQLMLGNYPLIILSSVQYNQSIFQPGINRLVLMTTKLSLDNIKSQTQNQAQTDTDGYRVII